MWEKELKAMIEAGKIAQKAILDVYHGKFDIIIKSDNSPVTEADKQADKIIKEYLSKKFPTYSFLTEESEDDLKRLQYDLVFIIDPVDGTQDFCARNGEFATNIALSYKHEIVVGVVVIPCLDDIYYAIKGQGAFYMHEDKIVQIHVSDKLDDLTLLMSRFHAGEYEQYVVKNDKRIKHVEAFGSSIKACRIARGDGEVYYRLNEGTKEWDIAPIDLIVKEAGGIFMKPNGENYRYNKEDVYNHEGFIILNNISNLFKE